MNINIVPLGNAIKDFFGIDTETDPRATYNRRSSDKPLTVAQVRDKYKMPRSFTDMLPWTEYLSESQCFLMDDYKSVGAVYELTPKSCEGRPDQFLKKLQEDIQNMLSSVPERDQNPWIMQIYVQDDDSLLSSYDKLEQSIPEVIRETEYTQEWLRRQKQHLDDVSHTDSLFYDDLVTDDHWSGKSHHVRMVFYRRQGQNEKLRRGLTPEIELNNTLKKVEAMLKSAGIIAKRSSGSDFFSWMLRWFNPKPPITKGNLDNFEKLINYRDDDKKPYFHDFAEGLLFSMPKSDDDEQCWYFDDIAHRILTVERLNRVPLASIMIIILPLWIACRPAVSLQ
ncbi:MAG: conjugal transfer protein TraC [gamma proteobacterium symbiont of Lucinoma myriamae]|nr:conjugal transfer protein TraC [gamma proteobacterium symbiont of Lucinoma myriamae]MCU7833222.1 conjugal transfer protein TraC [gamma proteobacterium symbiont of Lucinoma myriamae]